VRKLRRVEIVAYRRTIMVGEVSDTPPSRAESVRSEDVAAGYKAAPRFAANELPAAVSAAVQNIAAGFATGNVENVLSRTTRSSLNRLKKRLNILRNMRSSKNGGKL